MYNTKYPKCNKLHRLENYRDMAWYYKANFKTNSSKLENPKEKLF